MQGNALSTLQIQTDSQRVDETLKLTKANKGKLIVNQTTQVTKNNADLRFVFITGNLSFQRFLHGRHWIHLFLEWSLWMVAIQLQFERSWMSK